ncbi:hypothetical protein HQ535_15495 [bacterium]|nr:hypothetical protein [bacterium]
MIDLVCGDAPRGANYFGREVMLSELRIALQTDNVLLVAPRRFGKTGAMFQLLDQPAAFSPVYMNVQHIHSPQAFIVELIAALLSNSTSRKLIYASAGAMHDAFRWLRDLPESIALGGELGKIKIELRKREELAERWDEVGSDAFSLLAKGEQQTLLMIDEFPIMIQHLLHASEPEAKRCLHWLQRARQLPDSNTRFLFAGSINLLSTLDRHRLVDTALDLRSVRVPPWDSATTKAYVRQIFASRGLELVEGVCEEVLGQVGAPIPYMVALVLRASFERSSHAGWNIDREMVAAAVEEDLLRGPPTAVFMHYRTRIAEYYPGREQAIVRRLLGLVSVADNPVKKETLFTIYRDAQDDGDDDDLLNRFSLLLERMENDVYVRRVDGGYDFYSFLLKRWWRDRFGFQEGR